MQLRCPTCRTSIPAEDANLTTLVARCRACNGVFDFSSMIGAANAAGSTAGDAPTSLNAEPPPLPAGLSVRDDINRLHIERRWWRTDALFLIFFCIVWNAFLIFWYTIAFADDTPWMMKVFPIGHVAVGLFLTYYVLARIFNRTVVDVDYNRVRVKHRPLWWPGNRNLDAACIRQLRVVASGVTVNKQPRWNVQADTTDGRRITFVAMLADRDHAEYIERRLEQFLAIDNQP